jgi:23S rRNA (uracil1939-C5)-methyltransferase
VRRARGGGRPRTVELTIDRLAAGGDGVGRDADGRVTFVPRTAPGDRVRAELVEERARFARGVLRGVLAPGPDRLAPPCPLFEAGPCGGCQWQHLAAPAQAVAKQAIVADALRHLIAGGLALRPIVSPAPPLGWRRRARLHWERPPGAAAAVIGLYAPRSRRIVDVPACPQLEPALDGVLAAVRATLAGAMEGRGELHLLAGAGGAVHVVVDGRCDAAAARALVGRAGIAGVRAGGVIAGEPAIELEAGLRGDAAGFAQASAAGNAALCAVVDAAARPRVGARVLELFAGGGNLTRVLRGGGAERVVASDRVQVQDQDQDQVEVGGEALAPVEWRGGEAAAVVAEAAERGERFDLVVVDPPRDGMIDAVPALIALAAPRLVYVSCDPATLARDLAALGDGGYRPGYAQPLDLMPQTAHVEVVAVVAR